MATEYCEAQEQQNYLSKLQRMGKEGKLEGLKGNEAVQRSRCKTQMDTIYRQCSKDSMITISRLNPLQPINTGHVPVIETQSCQRGTERLSDMTSPL